MQTRIRSALLLVLGAIVLINIAAALLKPAIPLLLLVFAFLMVYSLVFRPRR